jgi:hypothetical protein
LSFLLVPLSFFFFEFSFVFSPWSSNTGRLVRGTGRGTFLLASAPGGS